ncbi:MAG: sensor histidine kinase [Sarcina sp.]
MLNYVIFYFIPLFFIYKDSISKKCFYSLFFYGIEILIVSITKFVLFILIDEGILNIIVILIILCLLVIILVTIVQILIFNFLKRESTKTLWKIKLYKIYLFLMLAIIYAVLEVPYIVQKRGIIDNKYIPKMTLGFILFAVALIISLYFILIFYFYKNILMEKNKAQSIEIRILNESLKERKILNEEKAKLVHDMKNHNIVMSLLVKKGKYDELLEYINQFDEQIDAATNKDMSANLILNNIFKFKKKQAMENNIAFNVDCRVAKESMINSFDITTLFGNLIDNAIEENNRINRVDKFININIWENQWILFFAIENLSDDEEVEEKNINKYLTTKKKDKDNHGFGIKNINKIIKKYDGFIKYKKEKGSFMVSGYMNKSEEVED